MRLQALCTSMLLTLGPISCAATVQAPPTSKLHILSIALDHYKDPSLDSDGASLASAEGIASVFKGQIRSAFSGGEYLPLSDKTATKAAICSALGRLARTAGAGDVVVVLCSGQFITEVDNGIGFLTWGAAETDRSQDLRSGDLRTALAAIRARTILFLQGTQAADALNAVESPHMLARLAAFAAKDGSAITMPRNRVPEPFMVALHEGLGGSATDATGKVTCASLASFLGKRVEYLSTGLEAAVSVVPDSMRGLVLIRPINGS